MTPHLGARKPPRTESYPPPLRPPLSFSCFAPKRDHDEWLGRGAVERESSRSLVDADTVISTASRIDRSGSESCSCRFNASPSRQRQAGADRFRTRPKAGRVSRHLPESRLHWRGPVSVNADYPLRDGASPMLAYPGRAGGMGVGSGQAGQEREVADRGSGPRWIPAFAGMTAVAFCPELPISAVSFPRTRESISVRMPRR